MTDDRRFAHLNIHFPLHRDSTASRWKECLSVLERRAEHYANNGVPVLWTSDTNHSPFPRIGKVVGGAGIDLIGFMPAKGTSISVLDRRTVDLNIDGHNAHGARVRIAWPTTALTFWIVQANFGRGVSADRFLDNVEKVKRAFSGRMLLGTDEIDEADRPDEHEGLRDTFPASEGYEIAGWGTYVPIVVPPQLNLKRVKVTPACAGLKKVTPNRDLVEAVITPR